MTGSDQPPGKPSPVLIDKQEGPWPFTTRRVYHTESGVSKVWNSRSHRKRLLAGEPVVGEWLGSVLWHCIWLPRQLNWWIGVIFALGSLMFLLASLLSLTPSLAQSVSLDSSEINLLYFAGSVPFTTAAYLQLFQSANAPGFPIDTESTEPELSLVLQGSDASKADTAGRPYRLFGWRPHDIGWLSCSLQFIGTLFFNVNTFDAMVPSLDWFQTDLLIWAPNIAGSILFLVSGYLAFIETCHAHWAWKPRNLSWWVVFINLLGCIGFMVSAILAITLPGSPDVAVVHASIFATLMGAIAFLVGSLLMLPETLAGIELNRDDVQSVT